MTPVPLSGSGKPVTTVFDGITPIEYKFGNGTLKSTYQLRLQTYAALKMGLQYVVQMTRPVAKTLSEYFQRWGVTVRRG